MSTEGRAAVPPPSGPTAEPTAGRVVLRPVSEPDLAIFFEHQLDPIATRMAAFASRNWPDFEAHWKKVLADPENVTLTVLWNGEVAGNAVCWEQDGEPHVGYWIGREYWGRGIASRALAALLREVPRRPLYARVARHNGASIRVLTKCGFQEVGEDQLAIAGEPPIDEVIMMLKAHG